MLKARPGKEAVVRTPDDIGVLAEFSKVVAEQGANFLAVSAWVEGNKAVIRLVTDDMLRTTDVLRERGYEFQDRDVVLVDAENKPGVLRHLTDTLSREGINLTHLFATTTLDQQECLVVLSSTDNQRAIVLLNR